MTDQVRIVSTKWDGGRTATAPHTSSVRNGTACGCGCPGTRRIRRTQEELEEGKCRPCCWPGCSHRERTGRA